MSRLIWSDFFRFNLNLHRKFNFLLIWKFLKERKTKYKFRNDHLRFWHRFIFTWQSVSKKKIGRIAITELKNMNWQILRQSSGEIIALLFYASNPFTMWYNFWKQSEKKISYDRQNISQYINIENRNPSNERTFTATFG